MEELLISDNVTASREFGQDCFSISSFTAFSLITLNTIVNILSNLNSNDNNNNNNNNNNNLNDNMNLGKKRKRRSGEISFDSLAGEIRRNTELKFVSWLQVDIKP